MRRDISREKLTSFKGEAVTFVKSSQVKEGVVCDVYKYNNTDERDLGIVYVDAGFTTPLQQVVQGDKTVEGYLQGNGTLTVSEKKYVFPNNETQEILVDVGETMQWRAGTDLIFYEICEPPYQDGRFVNLS